ncbi:MAG: response regulator transcription factor, partial [Pseudomonadota bacterium]|nr:response regulator transcription factor [Pseudomonadota bacterium]
MQEKKTTILVIEDDPQIRKMLGIVLEAGGYRVEEGDAGKPCIRLSASVKPDLILLDLGLPDIDGKEVITGVREWSKVPIIVLSVRNSDSEIAEALNLGADDYVTKPFSAEVLLARINANLRKSAVREAGDSQLANGPLCMNLLSHEVTLEGKKISFTPKEYDLLRYLMLNSGKMLTHRQ